MFTVGKSRSLAAGQESRQVVCGDCRDVDIVLELEDIELKDASLAQRHQCFKLLVSIVTNLVCPSTDSYPHSCIAPVTISVLLLPQSNTCIVYRYQYHSQKCHNDLLAWGVDVQRSSKRKEEKKDE